MRNTKSRNILMLVEGKKTEVKLFQKILSCFPEIQMNPENILVYNTNIWALNKSLMSVFGEEWYLAEDIELIEFLESLDDSIRGKKITDIFLVFDYERQDPLFDGKILEQMLRFFHNSTENGQLYLNYPMIESYKHLKKPFPDQEYLNRKCACGALLDYKSIVNQETSFMDVRRLEKEDLKQLVIHHLCKASYMINERDDISLENALQYCARIDYDEILQIQNQCATNTDGYVQVLCTCLFFVVEYNKKLLFDQI